MGIGNIQFYFINNVVTKKLLKKLLYCLETIPEVLDMIYLIFGFIEFSCIGFFGNYDTRLCSKYFKDKKSYLYT
jgi:hypothetical protein